jgi:hypothetical protein
VVLEVVLWRMCSDGEEYHALHWNMLSWFGVCTVVLRVFLFGCAERVVAWGFASGLGRAVVEHGIFGLMCGVVRACCLAFFGCWLGGSRGGD